MLCAAIGPVYAFGGIAHKDRGHDVDKKLLLGVVGAAVAAAGLWFALRGGDDATPDGKSSKPGRPERTESAEGGRKPPVVKKEPQPGAASDDEAAADLKLPGALPALKGVQPAVAAVPAQPHGKLELEGELAEDEAEKAVAAVFAPIRDCYAELRTRAPQAKGRMLMKFTVRSSGAGEAGTGELFLKETQFTDPAYLTCVRKAIDEAKFQVGRGVNGSVTVPMFLNPADADAAAAAKATAQ